MHVSHTPRLSEIPRGLDWVVFFPLTLLRVLLYNLYILPMVVKANGIIFMHGHGPAS